MKKPVFIAVVVVLLIGVPIHARASELIFSAIRPDGLESHREGDEFIEVYNIGSTLIQLDMYGVSADDGQEFLFPMGETIDAGERCRIYTNTDASQVEHNFGCIFNWGAGSARWNNNGDCALLFTVDQVIESFCYPAGLNPGEVWYPEPTSVHMERVSTFKPSSNLTVALLVVITLLYLFAKSKVTWGKIKV